MQGDPQVQAAHASAAQAAHAAAQAQAAHAAQHAQAQAQAHAQAQAAQAHADAMRRRASGGVPPGVGVLGVGGVGPMTSGGPQQMGNHANPMAGNVVGVGVGNVSVSVPQQPPPNVTLSPVAPVTPIMSSGPGVQGVPRPGQQQQQQQPQQQQQQQQIDISQLFQQGRVPVTPTQATPTGPHNTAAGIDGISQHDLERHQRSANGPTPDDPYWDVRLVSTFPMQGARPARRMQPIPPDMSEKARAVAAGVPSNPQQQQPPGSSGSGGHSASPQPPEVDLVRPFLEGLASAGESTAAHQRWTDLIRLKIKALELQIADARARERAAEVELHRLQSGVARLASSNGPTAQAAGPPTANFTNQPNTGPTAPAPNAASAPNMQNQQQFPAGGQFATFPLVNHARSPVIEATQFSDNMLASMAMGPPGQSHTNNGTATPQPVTAFDLEAMLGESNLDNLFSWLPDADGNVSSGHLMGSTAAPADLLVNNELMNMSGMNSSGAPQTPLSPTVKRPLSPESDSSPQAPPPKKGKPRGEKKTVMEQHAMCLGCGKAVARVLLRAPKTAIPTAISVEFRCPDCTGVHQPPTTDPHGAAGSSIGSTEARKRMRTAMEDDDLVNEEPANRRCFCDVCQRVVACGQVVGGPERSSLGNMAEIICASCDSKYQRCTDCGGGGGPRVGIGKWRLKQVFQPGRKTCSLSHSRLGDRPREIGVHVTPTDFTPEQLKEVISRCKALWTEKTLSRLAVPEMLEIDLPPGLVNPLRNFSDVDDIVTRCWPSREAMIRADGIDRNRFKRLLGLTWAHSRPRRTVRTVDIEEEYARNVDNGDDDEMSTVLANVKRTNVVIPAGSELIGMWGGEWDMQHGSLLVSTLIPFEGTDGEDTSALSVGELITKVQQLHLQMNQAAIAEARRLGKEAELVRACEHLWVVSGGSMPLIRERMADILVRKRSFVHVEEYLTRHPDFLEALKARPVGLHPDLHRPMPHQMTDNNYSPPQPLILVRWLGKDFDAQRILEIKQKEFGGGKIKGKVKKAVKAAK